MKQLLFFLVILYCSPFMAQAQQSIIITGRVVQADYNDKAIAGATIRASVNNKTVRSNADGSFIINLNSLPDTLYISHVGFASQQVIITDSNPQPLVVQLQPADQELEAVTINTGYQRLKPNQVNGSYSVIDNQKLNEQKGTSILDRLNGVAPGILFKAGKNSSTPNSPSIISIRGESTINGPLEPLIVLDNFPYDGDINNINPNDVESITLLKDAAATSIYGAKGANGVIVITTKKGSFGLRPRVEIGSTVLLTERPDTELYQRLSVEEHIGVEQFLFNNGYYNTTINSTLKPGVTPAVEIFLKKRNGLITASDSMQLINVLKQGNSSTAYNSLYKKQSHTIQNNFSVRGGTDRTSWVLGANLDQSNSYDRSALRRMNLRFNNSFKLGKNMMLEAGINYTSTTSKAGAPAYNSIRFGNITVPYLRFTDANGEPLSVAKDYRRDYTDTVGRGRLLNWNYYPATDYQTLDDYTKREDWVFNTGFTAKVIKGLQFTLNYQLEKQANSQEKKYSPESYFARDLVNRFTQLGAMPLADTFRIPRGGVLLNNNSKLLSHNGRAQLAYDQRWKGVVTSLSTLLGMEMRSAVTDGSSSSIYGYREDPLTYGQVDYYTRFRLLMNGSLANIPNAPKLNPVVTNRYVSTYWNAALTFYNRFSINSSLRRDAANIFGLKTNDRWNPFWSSGVGWELSKEKFFKPGFIQYLKLKATLGTSGIVNPNKTADAIIGYSVNSTTGFLSGQVSSLNNPRLKWERSQQLNIGFDFTIKNNRASGSIEYYNKKGKDLYGPSPFNYTAWGGARTIDLNVANMEGNGIDAMINVLVIDAAIKYNTGLIFNYNVSKTSKYFSTGAEMLSNLLTDGNTITPVVGKPLYAIAAYKWGGLNAKGDPQGYLNGQLSTDYLAMRNEANATAANIEYIGSANPTIFGAWNHAVNWKGFTLSVNLLYKLGYYFRREALSYQSLYTTGQGNREYSQRWQQPSDEQITNVPAQVYTNYPQFINRNSFYQAASINVLPADHIRLQFINLVYNRSFNNGILRDAGIGFNVANLGIIWRKNKYGLDPDYNYTATIPPRPQFAISLKASF